MNSAVTQSPPHESMLIWAIICSVLLHGLLAMVVPNLKVDEAEMPETLTVELVKNSEPPPAPAEPTPPPEVVKPQPKPLPKPLIQPSPTPVVQKNEPAPEQVTFTPPPPEVIAVAPRVEAAPPVQTVPVAAKPDISPPVHNQVDMDNARNQYGNSLWGAISKQKKYPRIAQMRGWEGEVIIELQLDGNGKLNSKKITQSSGYEVLDKQALEMVEKALPFPVPPEALRSSSFTITLPVPFKLQNS